MSAKRHLCTISVPHSLLALTPDELFLICLSIRDIESLGNIACVCNKLKCIVQPLIQQELKKVRRQFEQQGGVATETEIDASGYLWRDVQEPNLLLLRRVMLGNVCSWQKFTLYGPLSSLHKYDRRVEEELIRFIKTTLSHCSGLQHLELIRFQSIKGGFAKSFCEAIAQALSNLAQMKYLDLSCNFCSGFNEYDFKAITAVFCSLPQLQSLDLSGNLFGYMTAKEVAAALPMLPALVFLRVNFRSLLAEQYFKLTIQRKRRSKILV
jgi:hypothetical protein